jgi:hypothetical protein
MTFDISAGCLVIAEVILESYSSAIPKSCLS